MVRNRHTAEQIISKLRIAEVETSKGQAIGLVCRKLEILEQTYYKWRREYGGLVHGFASHRHPELPPPTLRVITKGKTR
ncbi:MAG: transposase [Pirellulales bacterium]